MTNRKQEHGIYSSIAEHLKFLGMTIFERMLGFCGFGGFVIDAGSIGERFTWPLGGWGGIIVNRCLTKGKYLKPILVFLAIIPGPSACWVPYACKAFVA